MLDLIAQLIVEIIMDDDENDKDLDSDLMSIRNESPIGIRTPKKRFKLDVP